MCKTYNAIYELARHSDSKILVCSLNHLKIEGELHRCKCDFQDNKCYDGIVTLKNAKVKYTNNNYEQEYEWINISAKYIQAFTFKH